MKPYAETAARRTFQIVADVIAIGAIVIVIWLATMVRDLIMVIAGLGTSLRDAGNGLSETMSQIGETLGSVPIIGPGIAMPFDGASNAGIAIADAGSTVQDTVSTIAFITATLIAAGPILLLLFLWLLPRLIYAVRAGQLAKLRNSGAGGDLLALRALTKQPVRRLLKVSKNPAASWRSGDQGMIGELAQLELARWGLRPARR